MARRLIAFESSLLVSPAYASDSPPELNLSSLKSYFDRLTTPGHDYALCTVLTGPLSIGVNNFTRWFVKVLTNRQILLNCFVNSHSALLYALDGY